MHWILGLSSLQAARGAHEGAAGAEAGDEVGDLALGLLPDFVGGGAVVGLPVLLVAVLVGVEVAVGLGSGQGAGLADGAVGAVGGVGPDDLGAVGGEDVFALRRDVGGHAERDGKAQRGAQHGVGDAGVAAGGVQQGAAVWGWWNLSRPRFSASSTMEAAARSLMEPPGFAHSTLPRIWTPGRCAVSRSRLSSGVLPMRSSRVTPSDAGRGNHQSVPFVRVLASSFVRAG